MLQASHKAHKITSGFQRIELDAGQFVFGRKQASMDLKMPEQTIRTCLKNLEKLGNISVKSTNRYSLITVLNWETYQGEENEINQQLTSRSPTTNQQLTTNKKDKKVKKDKKEPSAAEKTRRVKSPWKNSKDPMDNKQFVESMLKSKQRHVQIIGHLADQLKPGLTTKGQWQVFFDRYKKQASILVPFTDAQLAYGTRKAIEKYPDLWTLETIKKEILKRKTGGD